MSHPLPENEDDRLKTLRRLHIHGSSQQKEFDEVADAARTALGTEHAAVNLIFEDQQWAKATCGTNFDAPREHSFCSRAVAAGDLLVVEDTKEDERFADNPFVTGSPGLRFYAGAPLTVEGADLGTLCVLDEQPRAFTETDRKLLTELASVTSKLLEARLETLKVQYLSKALEQVSDSVAIVEGDPGALKEMEVTWTNIAYAMSTPQGHGSPVGTAPWIFEDLGAGPRADVETALREQRPLRGETDGKQMAPGKSQEGSREDESQDGESQEEAPYSVAWLLTPIRSGEGQVTHWMTVHRDITDRKAREKALEHRAAHDPLTGLLNRSATEERVRELANGSRQASSLLYMDLDGFKQVNDTYGHDAGDQLLKQVAAILKDTTRQQDAVGRVGGDEFVVWLSPPVEEGTASRVAERIAKACSEPFEVGGDQVTIGVSIGVVQNVAEHKSVEAAFKAADAAMYRVKGSANRSVMAHKQSAAKPGAEPTAEAKFTTEEVGKHPQIGEHLQLDEAIRRGLQQEEFEPFFLPTVDMKDGSLVGFEVLARWRREGKLVSPGEFLEVAEETSLIVPIGHQVIEQACSVLYNLRKSREQTLHLTVSGNFSRKEFFRPETRSFVEKMLSRYEFAPSDFIMEVTERAAAGDPGGHWEAVQALRDLGIRMEIDDFGTGLSSLQSLLQFPVDGLKIDRHLTGKLPENDRGIALVETALDLGDRLGLKTTVEGIETPGQLQLLRSLGCSHGQGYLFSRPVPAAELGPMVESLPWQSHWQDDPAA